VAPERVASGGYAPGIAGDAPCPHGIFPSEPVELYARFAAAPEGTRWRFDRPVFDIDANGVGVATYRARGAERSYTLVAFAHQLDDDKRSDRVIAEAWDSTFTLCDGEADEATIRRLADNVPRQEAGRISEDEMVLSRANKSVRLFAHVVDRLSAGMQPDKEMLDSVGYLVRTTAVYGSGKFGAADRARWGDRPEFTGSFQPELLAVWLIRTFSIDLAEHTGAMPRA